MKRENTVMKFDKLHNSAWAIAEVEARVLASEVKRSVGKGVVKILDFAETISRHYEGTLGERGGALSQRSREKSGAIEVRWQDYAYWRP